MIFLWREMTQEYEILSAQEFLNFFGSSHRQKDPKLPSATWINHQGKPELFYIFKKSDQFRTLRLVSAVTEKRSAEILPRGDHLHSLQGVETVKHATNLRLDTSGLAEVLQRNSPVCAVMEYGQRLERRKAGNSGGSDQKPSAEQAGDDAEASLEAAQQSLEEKSEQEPEQPLITESAMIKGSHILETPTVKKASKRQFSSMSSMEDSQGKFQRCGSSGAVSVLSSGAEGEPNSDMASAVGSKDAMQGKPGMLCRASQAKEDPKRAQSRSATGGSASSVYKTSLRAANLLCH